MPVRTTVPVTETMSETESLYRNHPELLAVAHSSRFHFGQATNMFSLALGIARRTVNVCSVDGPWEAGKNCLGIVS
jgi:hypothetical protein